MCDQLAQVITEEYMRGYQAPGEGLATPAPERAATRIMELLAGSGCEVEQALADKGRPVEREDQIYHLIYRAALLVSPYDLEGGVEPSDIVVGYLEGGYDDDRDARPVDENTGFDGEMARRFDVVADAAHDACAEHGVSKLRKIDRSEPFGATTINGRRIASEVVRAAIKAGLVTASERALRFIARSGSASHDDTVASLRAASHTAVAQLEDVREIKNEPTSSQKDCERIYRAIRDAVDAAIEGGWSATEIREEVTTFVLQNPDKHVALVAGHGPTPPQIVGRADNPVAALGAFIAQELDLWGFMPEADGDTATFYIAANPVVLKVTITEDSRV